MTARFFFNPRLLQRSLVIRSAFVISCAAASVKAAEFKFDFGSGKVQPGYTQVTPQTPYDVQRHFGFMNSAATATPDKPVVSVFAVDVEEGNDDVTMRFGDPESATSTTVKAEQRRLMVEKVEVQLIFGPFCCSVF